MNITKSEAFWIGDPMLGSPSAEFGKKTILASA